MTPYSTTASMVKLVCILGPLAVLCLGPRDALLRTVWKAMIERRWPRLRMWHWETLVIMAAVASIIGSATNNPLEWLGFAALCYSHGRNSVMFRLVEAQKRNVSSSSIGAHHVECYAWANVYFVLGELHWAAYFGYFQNWAGLAGVGVFTLYAQWRRWWVKQTAENILVAMKAIVNVAGIDLNLPPSVAPIVATVMARCNRCGKTAADLGEKLPSMAFAPSAEWCLRDWRCNGCTKDSNSNR